MDPIVERIAEKLHQAYCTAVGTQGSYAKLHARGKAAWCAVAQTAIDELVKD